MKDYKNGKGAKPGHIPCAAQGKIQASITTSQPEPKKGVEYNSGKARAEYAKM